MAYRSPTLGGAFVARVGLPRGTPPGVAECWARCFLCLTLPFGEEEGANGGSLVGEGALELCLHVLRQGLRCDNGIEPAPWFTTPPGEPFAAITINCSESSNFCNTLMCQPGYRAGLQRTRAALCSGGQHPPDPQTSQGPTSIKGGTEPSGTTRPAG